MSADHNVVRAAGVLLLTVCVGVGILSAHRHDPGQRTPTPPPSVPDRYAFLYSTGPTRSAEWEAARQALPYESITIKRGGCFGECPIYSATLHVDGTATYNGERFVEHIGAFSGKVYLGDFAQLSMFVERLGFMNLADGYRAPWTDDETVNVTVTTRTGSAKIVTDYGRFGPPDLWVLERAIDGVIDQIKWTPGGAGR